ncbi:MAG: thioredoxin domain-containing protein [Syntrophales bacterium]
MKPVNKYRNRLASEKSPYLIQHAANPVDWYPWGPEAFATARTENKPIFLSIGYSTCHWCHVMAHESFEDIEVARAMNDAFISIKVDREERPDIDSLYMTVAQMMTGRGGWPLTVIMTPEKEPFFAATYIPKETRFGLVGMLELIPRIKDLWENHKDEVLQSAGKITDTLQNIIPNTSGDCLSVHLLSRTHAQLTERFDFRHGGFGTAPKFPTPHNLLFLLRYWKNTGDEKTLRMVEDTLRAMRLGGIYDHVGFGFHRYSTDAEWLLPHFEKMLYDQAMLAMVYIEAYQATGKREYQNTAREIFTYVLRDMTAPEGGFYSAEDADSEGKEGKFYTWTELQINEVLDEKEAGTIIKLFDIAENGNFPEEATGRQNGTNILHQRKPLEELAVDYGMPQSELQQRLEKARLKLFEHREKRVRPHKDDKILTDWNGLMIAALAKGAQAFNEPLYSEAARRAADFILRNMRTPDGQLLHRYRDGEADLLAYAEGYAFLIWGLLDLYEATFHAHYLESAISLNTDMLEHFWDDVNGGFYSSSDKGEKLLVRQKEIYDGAIPSGNSIAMLNLIRLGRMTANQDLEKKASTIGSAFSETVNNAPMGFAQLMCALDFSIGPAHEIVIAGDLQASDTQVMLEALRTKYIPNKVVLFNPVDKDSPKIHKLASFTKHQTSIDGKATAYVCSNYKCEQPVTDVRSMLELLGT